MSQRRRHIVDQCCLSLLQSGHRYARWLSVVSNTLRLQTAPPRRQRHEQQPQAAVSLRRATPRRRNASLSVRAFLLLVYWCDQLPQLAAQLATPGRRVVERLFVALPIVSMSLLAVLSLLMQARLERHEVCVANRFLTLYRRCLRAGPPKTVAEPSSRRFRGRFLLWLALKWCLTLFSYAVELPELLRGKRELPLLAALCGAYVWLGVIALLDAVYLGYLTSASMYAELADRLRALLRRLRRVDERRLSCYQRMQVLCESADRLDACDALYSQVYASTQEFHWIFEWQTLYYLLYNFTEVLTLLHRAISAYLYGGVVEPLQLMLLAVKLGNLALLVMCVDQVVRQARMSDSLPLDVLCSGQDARWDKSVESFLARRQLENLRISVLGFFELDNECLLAILSSVISYLFIMIQFGVDGGQAPSNSSDSTALAHSGA